MALNNLLHPAVAAAVQAGQIPHLGLDPAKIKPRSQMSSTEKLLAHQGGPYLESPAPQPSTVKNGTAPEIYANHPADAVNRRPDYAAGYGALQGYASNPLSEEGRERMAYQFKQAPLGGHVRAAAEGLGLDADHARMAEQGLAGLTAVGIGVPAFMAAVHQLSTPPDQNAIPL